jgi:hypothetical protein
LVGSHLLFVCSVGEDDDCGGVGEVRLLWWAAGARSGMVLCGSDQPSSLGPEARTLRRPGVMPHEGDARPVPKVLGMATRRAA